MNAEDIKPTPRTDPAAGMEIGPVRTGAPGLPATDLKTYESRLEWARWLLGRVDSAARAEPPLLPYALRGVDDREIHRIRRKLNANEADRAVLQRWREWKRSVTDARERNRLNLWSLLRMARIFAEKPETVGEAEVVRRFLCDRWNLEPEDVENSIAGNINAIAQRAAS
jgi:hypothetical protein